MKTIFITSFHPLISRNIFSSGLLGMLSSNSRVVILVPDFKKDYFIKEYSGNNIIIEGIEKETSKKNLFFHKLFLFITPTKTLHIKHKAEILTGRKSFLFPVYLLINKTLGNSKKIIKFLRFLDYYFSEKVSLNNIINKYKPDLFFATDVQNELDILFLQEAKKLNIKNVGMIRSWDNVTTKGILRIIPDYLLVNNDTIKNELKRYNFVEDNKILVIGIPHYDNYTKQSRKSKEEFYKQMNFNLKEKMLLFAPIGNRYIIDNKTDEEVLKILAMSNNNILVRLPPGDEVNFNRLYNKTNIYFDKTGSKFWKGSIKSNEISNKDEEHFINSLYYSDIVICGPSTICIDAAVLDKPIILINFEDKKRKYFNSISRYYDYNHMSYIIKSGGVKVANSKQDLRKFIDIYLKNSKVDQEKRQLLVKKQVYSFDGRSTQRLAKVLFSCLN